MAKVMNLPSILTSPMLRIPIRYNAGMTITPIAQTTAKFRFDSINLFSRIIISFLPIFPLVQKSPDGRY